MRNLNVMQLIYNKKNNGLYFSDTFFMPLNPVATSKLVPITIKE